MKHYRVEERWCCRRSIATRLNTKKPSYAGLSLHMVRTFRKLFLAGFAMALISLGEMNCVFATRWVEAPTLRKKRSDVFIRCVEEYDPAGIHDFVEGKGGVSSGFRNMSESIRPYHPHPEWMIFPERSFALDQKMCSMYTLATGLFTEINKALRQDNEDSLRRHAAFIHELREVLRFKVDEICTPQGRRCKPFQGLALRGIEIPIEHVESVVGEYEVGREFVWPAFTSCNLADNEKSLWPFDGNLNFEIKCEIDPRKMDVSEVFAPVRISRFLHSSNDVLFPPQTRFRVTGKKDMQRVKENSRDLEVHTRMLEVVDLPAPWYIERDRM